MRTSLFISCALLCASSLCLAQSGPEKGGREVQIWAGGRHSASGGRGDTGAFNDGLRYGWILTGPQLPGFLPGSFEYPVDPIPVFFVFQPPKTPDGMGIHHTGLHVKL